MDSELIVRAGGACMVLFLPVLLTGGFLSARIGPAVMSGSSGDIALRRIAEVRPQFRVMNALFHLGPILLLPGIVALVIVLSPLNLGAILLGSVAGLIGLTIPIGWIFSLNEGLARLARRYAIVSGEERLAMASAADMNLGTQAGGELLQSAMLGLWALIVSLVILAVEWPAWMAYLGMLAGIGMILAGFASAADRVPVAGKLLGFVGGVGVFSLGAWIAVVGFHLMTIPVLA